MTESVEAEQPGVLERLFQVFALGMMMVPLALWLVAVCIVIGFLASFWRAGGVT